MEDECIVIRSCSLRLKEKQIDDFERTSILKTLSDQSRFVDCPDCAGRRRPKEPSSANNNSETACQISYTTDHPRYHQRSRWII